MHAKTVLTLLIVLQHAGLRLRRFRDQEHAQLGMFAGCSSRASLCRFVAAVERCGRVCDAQGSRR